VHQTQGNNGFSAIGFYGGKVYGFVHAFASRSFPAKIGVSKDNGGLRGFKYWLPFIGKTVIPQGLTDTNHFSSTGASVLLFLKL
jgi:hypothetical protein